MRIIISLVVLFLFSNALWGFFAHQKINRIAVFSLPPEMLGFYKSHIQYLSENAVNPDRRRYAVEGEAPRHYIDLDEYGDNAIETLPRNWNMATDLYSEDSLNEYGIAPWNVNRFYFELRDAFMLGDPEKILRISADLGHYVADSNVPLHTTKNYNGQLTGQYGIHGFWESRLPELYFDNYDLFVGKAEYLPNVIEAIWNAVAMANAAVDSVLTFEMKLSKKIPESKKYMYEQRGNGNMKQYSIEYSKAYHKMLNGMVERQMRRSIKLTADLWFSSWVDAGQPDLEKLIDYYPTQEELVKRQQQLEQWKEARFKSRIHEN